MKQYNLFLLLSVCISCASVLRAQVVFNFVPEVYARTVDGLSNCQLINSMGERVEGQVSITVNDIHTGAELVSVLTAVASYLPGTNTIPRAAFQNSQFQFAKNKLAHLVNQTRTFPPGSYRFCFEFIPLNHGAGSMESCFETTVQPLVPITLIQPADLDTICNKRPLLTWQPPLPLQAGMLYRLQLTEKLPGQGPEVLLQSAPLLLLDKIAGSSLVYPGHYPPLKEGAGYYWQVGAYQDGLLVSTSETWEFTVKCREEQPEAPGFSYRELKSIANGNYYYANRVMRFSITNHYSSYALRYTISDLKNKGTEVKNLPKILVQPGHNQVDIDLSDSNLLDGGEYLLRVYPFNEQPVQVRFIYKENKEEVNP